MLNIVTLNLNYYDKKRGKWEDRKKIIVEALKEVDAAVVVLQAVCSDPAFEKGKNQAKQLYELLDGFKICIFCPVERQENGSQLGNAILSKYPVTEVAHILLRLEPATDDSTQRLVLKAALDLPDGILYVFNGHLSWIKEQTERNVQELLPFINSVSEKALFLGDMNSDPKDELLKPLEETGWADVWKVLKAGEDGFTFDSDRLFTRVDCAFANNKLKPALKQIKVLKKEKGSIKMSDHLGLLVGLDI